MFTNNFKLDGIDNILEDIGYLDEMKDAGEDQEHKYTKKSGKKSKDYDGDGTVEDETDEYAGVKDRAIKKATGKCSKCGKEPCECDDVKESSCTSGHGKKKKKMVEDADFSTVLDELTDEDILFLTDDLIEEVVEEFFYETLEEGFEIDELETILLEQVEAQLEYLDEAKVTVGHDSNSEVSRPSRLAKVKDAVKKVASGAKAVAKKVAGAAGEVAGSAVAGYKKASAAAKDAPSSGSSSDDSKTDTSNTGSKTPAAKATGTKRPGLLGRVAAGLKSGLKKAIHGAGKAAGKVVKTAKAGYDEGRGKTESKPEAKPAPAAKPAAKKPAAKPEAKPEAKPASPAAKTATAKKKSKSNLDNLLSQIRNEAKMTAAEIKKETQLKDKYDESGMKASMQKQYGSEKGDSVYFATIRKKAMQTAGYEPEGHLLDEAGKLQGGGKDPCWKGYEMVGMKKKGGREVPNCVPKEEYEELVMDMIAEGYDMDQVREVIAAYEDGFEVIFEEDGVVINETQEVLDEETQFLADVEMVADWLHAEGVIENEDEFFELMEDLSEEEVEELYDMVLEATAMAKRGYDEAPIRNKIAANTQGGKSADRAKALADKPTYGQTGKGAPDPKARQNLARKQMGDHRQTTSSNPGLHVGQHKSDDPKVKAKQAARGAQRGKATLTPKERKDLNMGYEMIGNSLEEGGLEVRNYSWKEVMEAQQARNNPEKYEREQAKKSAPVRGEKTPMPPRGDKRREDFEKWYAANVR